MADQNEHEFLTRDEAADFLRLKPQTLALWATQGRGPKFIRIGGGPRGKTIYSAAECRRWAESRSYSSTAEEHVAGGADD